MGRTYSHLSYEERQKLSELLDEGESLREISRQLGRAASTVSRELTRLKNELGDYHPYYAQKGAKRRRRGAYRKPRLKSNELQQHVLTKLELGWSPEQVAGRLRREGAAERVSAETIYRYIYDCKPEYSKYLCRHHAKRKKFRQGKHKKAPPIPQRTPISERPAEVQLRQELGHWECDLMTSKQSNASLQVCVERVTRYSEIRLIPSRKARAASSAIIEALKKHRCLTLTYDNGAENASHRAVNYSLKTKSYFCDVYHSWQKGTVENTIGLIRRRYAKRTDLSTVPLEALKRLQGELNSRPRKCLQYATPMEVLEIRRVALHS
jgi:IS30 family transposase